MNKNKVTTAQAALEHILDGMTVTIHTLFVAIKIGKSSLPKVLPYMLWYYIAILMGLMLVTYRF